MNHCFCRSLNHGLFLFTISLDTRTYRKWTEASRPPTTDSEHQPTKLHCLLAQGQKELHRADRDITWTNFAVTPYRKWTEASSPSTTDSEHQPTKLRCLLAQAAHHALCDYSPFYPPIIRLNRILSGTSTNRHTTKMFENLGPPLFENSNIKCLHHCCTQHENDFHLKRKRILHLPYVWPNHFLCFWLRTWSTRCCPNVNGITEARKQQSNTLSKNSPSPPESERGGECHIIYIILHHANACIHGPASVAYSLYDSNLPRSLPHTSTT